MCMRAWILSLTRRTRFNQGSGSRYPSGTELYTIFTITDRPCPSLLKKIWKVYHINIKILPESFANHENIPCYFVSNRCWRSSPKGSYRSSGHHFATVVYTATSRLKTMKLLVHHHVSASRQVTFQSMCCENRFVVNECDVADHNITGFSRFSATRKPTIT